MASEIENLRSYLPESQAFSVAELEACRFPTFDKAESRRERLLTIGLELEGGKGLQRLFSEDPTELRSLVRVAWSLVLACYTGLEDVCFGYQDRVSGVELCESDQNPGSFRDAKVVRTHISGSSTVGELLDQDCKNGKVIYRSNGVSGGPIYRDGQLLFDTLMLLDASTKGEHDVSTAQTSGHKWPSSLETSVYSICLNIELSSGVLLFGWRSSSMSGEQAMNVASAFDKTITETLTHRNIHVADLNHFSERHAEQVWAWNSNDMEDVQKCIHDVVKERADLQPNAEAVCAWDGSLTYSELEYLSNCLAHRLVGLGVGPEVLVPLCFDKSKWTIVAVFGVLKAGGTFVPLDPTHPTPRLKALTQKVGAKVLLCSRKHMDMLAAVTSDLIPVDQEAMDQLGVGSVGTVSWGSPHNGAYMIFTSGTTGEPKGALIEHRAILSSAKAHGPGMMMNSETRSLQFAASTFDVSITEILTTLTLGGCVCIPSEEARLNDIEGAINALRVNWALLTPTFVKFINPADVPGLTTLVTGGEAMTQGIIRSWSHINLINCYGPAETSVVSHVHRHMTEGTNPLNIGHQVGIHCWIVDRYNHNRLMPVGAVGELVIEGYTLAREYFNEADKTAEAFIFDPLWARNQNQSTSRRRMYKTGDLVRYNSDGTFHIAGRKDTQIKFHGQRIELGEIEHHLNRSHNIKHGMVLLPKAGYCQGRLLTMVQLCNADNQDLVTNGRPYKLIEGKVEETANSKAAEIKEFLSARLPGYMVPSLWLVVEFIPRLQSGKLDRKRSAKWVEDMNEEIYHRLNPITSDSTEALSTATETELKLRSIWAHILNLKLDQIGLRQAFLSLGGDSISAMQVLGLCRKQGIGLTVRNIITCKSISSLALQVKAIDTPSQHQEAIEQCFDLSPIQHLYFSRADHSQGHYNQSFLLSTSRRIGREELKVAVETVVKRHSMLRARFSPSGPNGEWQQRVTNEITSSFRLRVVQVDRRDQVDSELADSQKCLDEVNGPMFAADLIDAKNENQLLFVVAHHLVIDLVSWRVILEDLEELLCNPDTATTSEKPLPYQTWCRLQAEHCRDSILTQVLPVEGVPSGDASYWGMVDRPHVYADMTNEGFELDSYFTSMLRGKCHEPLRTEIPDILIAAMIHSFAQVFNDRPTPPVFVEGHGRESWDPSIDLSRVVGWFTTMYPVYMDSTTSNGLIDTLKMVKDLRRKIPDKGRPYFASRWLTPQGRESFEHHWPLEMTFNYLGQYQQLEREGALFKPAKDIAGETRGATDGADIGPRTPCISFFEISAVILKGTLRFSFTFNQHMKYQDTIRQWISGCQQTLCILVENLSKMSFEPTLSDYPLLPLTYNRLEIMATERLPEAGIQSFELIEDIYPCSQMQQGLLVSTTKDSAFYAAYTLHEVKVREGVRADAKRLAVAWLSIVERHPILRTIFIDSVSQQDALYDQVVLKRAETDVVQTHCGKETEAIESLSLPPLHHEDNRQLLHRFSICTSASGKVYCRLDISHVIMDGTSLSIVFRDLALAYEGKLDDAAGPLYSNYIAHLQSQPIQPGIDYWKSYLANVKPCHFPDLDDGEGATKKLKYVRVDFKELTELQDFCNEQSVTISNAIYVAWALTLRYYTNSEEVCFGYLTSARDAPIEGIQDMVGPLINMLVCRAHVADTKNARSLMSQVQHDYMESLPHRHVPLAEVQHALHLSTTALFNTAMSYRRLPPTPSEAPSVSFVECAPTYDPDEFNVSINIEAGETNMAIDLAYWTDCLSDNQAANVASTFTRALSNILHHSETPVGKLDSLSGRNRQHIGSWNGRMPEAVETCVHDIIKQQTYLRPEAPAVASWDANFSYAELDEITTKLAHFLVGLGVKPEVFVLICFEKSAFTIVAMLAVLKAGGVCVPLDPAHPKAALKLRADDTGAQIVLAARKLVPMFEDIAPEVLAIDTKFLEQLPSTKDKAIMSPRPDNACFIIYTSGSTGKPKGVVLEHRGITTSAKYHGPLLGYAQHSRVLQFASYTFDNSLAEIFTTLMRGGCVCVPSDHDRLNDLAGAINKLRVSFIDITPTVATFLHPSEVPTLKRMALGGEAVTKRAVEIWGDSVSLHACYGPSECSINSTYSGEIGKPGKATNIGRAIGCVSWVADPSDHNRLVPVGCVGELLVDGPIVSRGYLNNPEKTKESFLTNPTWHSNMADPSASESRIYKTGDLVRYDSDGTLIYLGRKDTQVKLNGQRIELGEIEHHIEQNLNLNSRSAVELVVFGGKKALACFVCLEPDSTVPDASDDNMVMPMYEGFQSLSKALEITLGSKMPAYMVPTVWLPMFRMPMTSSGKLNRRSLRMSAQAVPESQLVTYKLASKSGIAPSSDMEMVLVNMWASILDIEPNSIGVDDSFFKLGGDSIGAMRLVTAARSKDLSLTVTSIFQKSTLYEMARSVIQVSKGGSATLEPFSMIGSAENIGVLKQYMAIQTRVNPQSVEDIYPCTTIQEGMITLSTKEPGAYVAQMIYRLLSGTDIDRFKWAWESVVRAEAILRTRIVHTEYHGFLQVVIDKRMTWSSLADLSGIQEQGRRLPAYNGGDLSHYTIVGENTDSPHFVWTIHHALYDGWSLPLILEKVKTCYSSSSTGYIRLSRGPMYSTFIKYLQSISSSDSDNFWRSNLSDISSKQFPKLPTPSYQASASGMLSHTTPISRQQGSEITTATTIRAAWALVVAAHSGSNDVVFWETVTGRDAPVTGIEDMLAPTLATIPTRLSIDSSASVSNFLSVVQARSAEAMVYQYAGIQHIKRVGADAAIACSAQNLIAVNSGRKSSDGFWNEQNNEMAGTNFYTYPLMMSCFIGDGEVEIDAHYDEEVLPTWQMKRLIQHFAFVIEQLGQEENNREIVGDLEVLSLEDQATISSWNNAPIIAVDRCVHHLVEVQGKAQKETKLAVRSWDVSFTYKGLDELSSRVAHHLSDSGVGPHSIVPLCFEKSAWAVVAMLAVLKSGAAFVPLDPAHPQERLLGIIGDVEARLILCSQRYQKLCNQLTSIVIPLDQDLTDSLANRHIPHPNCSTNSVAYIIFTSGTTGKPKGTTVEHSAFCTSAIAHGTAMEMQRSSRVLQFASYTFDASIMEILTTLIMGGTVCVPSDEARLSNITDVINEMDVNWALLTPSLAQFIQPSSIPRFETLVLGGEAMSQSHISAWSNHVRLMNAYGPSETAVVATVNPNVTLKAGPANMGRAVGGKCWVADPQNHDRLVPIGAIGELLVEGPILARGYLNNNQKTAESFIKNPKWAKHFNDPSEVMARRMYKTGDLVKYAADGTMVFQGRKDTQAKLHGQRLELSEIEHYLSVDQVVQHGLAAIPTSGYCEDKLVAVVSLRNPPKSESQSDGLRTIPGDVSALYLPGIRERISGHLPPYMVPSKWVVLQELPLQPSGKLDRRRIIMWVENMSDENHRQISEAENISDGLDREASSKELKLQSIWARVLNLPTGELSFSQSFLHLGGDSISAMQVMASCRSEKLAVTVPQIMQSKSILELASHVTSLEEVTYEAEDIEKIFELSPIQQLYFESVGDDWRQFNQSVLLRLKRRTELDEMSQVVDALMNAHSMLRARFSKSQAGVWEQRISQDIPGSYRIRSHQIGAANEELSRIITESQKLLDIENGPLFAVDMFEVQGSTDQLVAFLAHHLVVDVVSWHIIIQDIEHFFAMSTPKAHVSLPFQIWSSLQASQAKKETARQTFQDAEVPKSDFAYWGMGNQANIHGDVISETFELDARTTLLLLGPCHEATRTEPVDIFVASILESFRHVFTDRVATPAIYNEGHGREPWDNQLDLSRTVGWFTTMCPIFLPEMPLGNDNLIDVLRWVKEFRGKIPGKGRPYFAHRLLTEEGKEKFSSHWPMEVTFNYLGQTQQLERKDAFLQPVSGSAMDSVNADSDVGAKVPRFSLFEISAFVVSGSLRFTFSFNRHMQRQNGILQWVSECQVMLQQAVERLMQMAPEPTMSDFPLLPLTYNGMAKLNRKLPQIGANSVKELEDVYPCSPVQQGILFTQIKNPDYYSYSITFEALHTDLGSFVDVKRLAAAWQAVVQRHSTLRTVFVDNIFQEGKMDQVVLKEFTARVSWLSGDESEIPKILETLQPISCAENQPPHRLTICKSIDGKVFCVLEMSHAIADGTSMPILFHDLALAYESKLSTTDEVPLYSNYIAHLQWASQPSDLEYWKTYLTDLEPCYFPTLTDEAPNSKALEALDQELSCGAELRSFCAKNGVTLSNVLQLVWALVLQSYTGSDDVCFGYLTSGRDIPVSGIENAIGVFINMLTCRVNLLPSLELGQVLKNIQTDLIQAMDHQHVSLADVQHKMQMSGNPLFNTAYSFQKRSVSKAMSTGLLAFEVLDAKDPSEYDITVNIEVWNSTTEVQLCYWNDKISEMQARNVASTFDHILTSIVRNHDAGQKVGELDLLSDYCQKQVMSWNYALPDIVERCVHEIFEQNARSQPTRTPAVSGWDASFTYEELDTASSHLADHLSKFGVKPEIYVPLCFEKSGWTVVAMIGVLKAGGAFVPLDPNHPEERIKYLLDSVEAKVVLCSSQFEEKLAGSGTQTLVVNEKLISNISKEPRRKSPVTVTSKNPAYIIFTSGTTGLPKGTIIEHGAFSTGSLAHAKAMNLRSTSRVLQFASHTFDASIMEILSTLIIGGCICVPSDQDRMNDLTSVINAMNVTWTLLTPSVANVLKPGSVPGLEVLATGGEAMSENHITKWADHACLVNAYGPSETSVIAATSIKVDESGSILNSSPACIGSAVGSRCWVVDPRNHDRLMPVGSIGELVVEGRIVARSYLKNEQKTKESFISSPNWRHSMCVSGRQIDRMYKTGDLVRLNSDGSLNYIGRKDTQIKLNGQRIELGEIEYHVKVNLPDEIQSMVDLVVPESKTSAKALAVFFTSNLEPEAFTPINGQPVIDDVLLPMSLSARSTGEELKSALEGALPAYMVPTLFVPILKMPWTSAGKLDRQRLRNVVQKIPLQDVALYKLASSVKKRAPSNAMEKRLQGAWEKVLRLDPGFVGKDDSFFRIGGDSISAMQLVAVARLARISLTVVDIFRHPKLLDMAKFCILVEGDDQQQDIESFVLLKDVASSGRQLDELAQHCRVRRDQIIDAYPCSSLQAGLITLSMRQPGAYVAKNIFEIPLDVDIDCFQAAWDKTIEEVDILRSRIVQTNSMQFYQVVLDSHPILWRTKRDTKSALAEAQKVPRHNGAPLTHYSIVNDSASGSRFFVWTIHHALYDAWSMPAMLKKVEANYFQEANSQPQTPFINFIKYLSQVDGKASDEFWIARFEGASPTHFPPVLSSNPDDATTSTVLHHTTTFSQASMALDITIPTIVRTAWALVIASRTDSDDVFFGETLSGRDVPVTGITDILGPTLTTVPTRIQIDRSLAVSKFLKDLHEQAADVIPYQHAGLQHIKRLGEHISVACDFNNLLVVQNGGQPSEEKLWHPVDDDAVANFFTYPLVLECSVGRDRLDITAHHDEGIISSWQMQRVLDQFDSIVGQLISASHNSGRKMSEIKICSDDDIQQIQEWNRYKPGLVDDCIPNLFLQQASLHPANIAICAWDGDFTYREVNDSATLLANYLVGIGIKPESLIPVCMDKSAWTAIAMLGVLMAGGGLVLLDPGHPFSRHSDIIADTGANTLICSPRYRDRYLKVVKSVIPVDHNLFVGLRRSERLPSQTLPLVRSTNAAFVIYTSGSTGKPKGVLLEHRAFCTSSAAFMRRMFIKPTSRVFHFTSYAFDIAMGEIFSTFSCGACLCIPTEESRTADLTGAIDRLKATWAFLTPSVANILDPNRAPSLETLVCGGEALSAETVNIWADKVTLVNGYGPAECTVFAVANASVSIDKDPTNIGRALEGGHTWIADPMDHNHLSPVGCVGELLLEGPILARGYINDPQKTSDVFIENPTWAKDFSHGQNTHFRVYKTGDLVKYNSEGNIIFMGRKDHQVKLHGQRMELGEIEHNLEHDLRIRHALVSLPKSGLCKQRLVAVISLRNLEQKEIALDMNSCTPIAPSKKSNVQAQMSQIQEALSEKLPPYMVPTTWLVLEAIPLLVSGKVDRNQVQKWVEGIDTLTYKQAAGIDDQEESKTPDTATGKLLRRIWSSVLNVQSEKMNTSQPFLSLGGDSITAMQIMAQAREAQISLSLQEVLRCKSILHLAHIIDTENRYVKTQVQSQIESFDEDFDLSPIQRLYFDSSIDQTSGDQFNQSFLLRLNKRMSADDIDRALQVVLGKHSMLRARFHKTASGVWQQRIIKDVKSSYRFQDHHLNDLSRLAPIVASSQAIVDLRAGPLCVVDLFDLQGNYQIVSLIAHHLVVDMVSWLNILQDLETVLVSGSLKPDQPFPFQAWCAAQARNAKAMETQSDFFLPFTTQPADFGYWDMAHRRNVYGDTKENSFLLTDNAVTASALGDCHNVLRTEPVDLFVSSILHAFARVFGDRSTPTLFNEGHGREPWDSSIDLSRTVGWFTSLSPIYIPIENGTDDVVNTIRHVKDARRSIPNNGRPYFAHRYLTEKGRSKFSNHMPMEVTFNYLGRTQEVGHSDSVLEAFDYEKTEEQSAMMADVGSSTSRLALFEISVSVSKKGLRMTFMYNKHMKHQNLIHRWTNECRVVLEQTIRCLKRTMVMPTLSDLPLLPITYAGLDKLMLKSLPEVRITKYNDVEDIYPCSPMQTGILLSQLKDSGRYIFHMILEVKSSSDGLPINAQKLSQACQQVVDRHPALRTVFINSVYRGGTFDQVVVKKADSRVTMIQCRESDVITTLNTTEWEKKTHNKGPKLPIQFTLCETLQGKVFLKVEINHAVTDGASTSLLVRDIARAYRDGPDHSDAPLYRDYIQYISCQPMDASIDFWKSYLNGAQPSDFPLMNPDLTAERHLGSIVLRFDRFAELQKVCSDNEITLSNVMLAAWAIMLRRYTRLDDVCFGYIASGRDAPIEGIENIIGAFINMLVFRFRFTPTMSLKSLFSEAQEDYLQSLPHQHCSLAKVQHEIGGPSRGLFNTALSIQNSAASDDSEEGLLNFDSIAAHDPSEYTITLNINTARNDEGVVFRYWTDVLSQDQAEGLAKSFAALLTDFVDNPDQDVSQLSLFQSAVTKENDSQGQNLITLDTSELQRIIRECTKETIQQMLDGGVIQRSSQGFSDTKLSDTKSEIYKHKSVIAAGALPNDSKVNLFKPKLVRTISDDSPAQLRLAEMKLMTLWKDALGLDEYDIEVEHSFFELGGDSIIAMTMVGAAREEGLPLTVADVFRNPTFGDMLRTLQSNEEFDSQSAEQDTAYSGSEVGTIAEDYEPFSLLGHPDIDSFLRDYVCPSVHTFRGGIVDVLPVTDFQALAITGSLLDSRWMLNYFYLDGHGPLDLRMLKQSAFRIVQAFEVLRTVFIPHGKRYLQVVLRQLQPEFIVYDGVEDIEDFSVTFEQKSRQESPLLGESYVQFVVVQTDSDRHRIFLRLSHAQYDGVCFPAILDALRAGYHGQPIPITPSFSTYVRKSIGQITPDHYSYWRDLLRGSSMTNIVRREQPTYNRGEGTVKTLKRIIPIRPLASKNITSATIVKAAWSLVLAQVTAKSDIVFGHIISGRNTSVAGVESIVGPCVNMVPVRVQYRSDWTVLDLLRVVQHQQVDNMQYESLGFREIIKKCTDWDDWTNFSTILQHQSMVQSSELSLGNNNYRIGNMASQEDFADFSVVSTPIDADNIEVCLIFAPGGAVTTPFAEQVFDTFCKAVTAFSVDPSASLPSPADLSMMVRQTLEEIISPSIYPSLDSVLGNLSKKELYMLSDSLSRAWHQILREDHGKPVFTPLDSSFFKLGGDIIGLAHVATLLGREGYKIRLEDLIDNPVMRDQLALLSLQKRQGQAQCQTQSSMSTSVAAEEQKEVPEKKPTFWRKSAKLANRIMGRKT